MWAIGAAFAFAIAVILNLADLSKGHLNATTLMLIGLFCLAMHLVWGVYPWRNRTARRTVA
jgi:hypothetical protein